jgi:hypothetical protein
MCPSCSQNAHGEACGRLMRGVLGKAGCSPLKRNKRALKGDYSTLDGSVRARCKGLFFAVSAPALIGVIPFLARAHVFGESISPYEAQFRLMRIAKNIDV